MELLENIVKKFGISEKIESIEPFGSGHINRTYLVKTEKAQYILQKMNNKVFPKIAELMENVVGVTKYLRAMNVETLNFLIAEGGKYFIEVDDGFYRCYEFVDGVITYQTAEDENAFMSAGAAFGEFANQLAGYDASKLHETIVKFHDTPKRFRDFKTAYNEDVKKRLDTCRTEAEFVLSHESTYSKITDGIADGTVPLRVTHNDTKLNNILIDEKTGKARLVIDLDTIMPGSLLYDFGDAIRFGASTAKEDEEDLSKVHFSLHLFEVYAKGYCPAVKASITKRERELLPIGAYMMTIECGMRFLTDYLNGDTYFATKYPTHNLVRARTQLRLAHEMEQHFDEMAEIINKVFED